MTPADPRPAAPEARGPDAPYPTEYVVSLHGDPVWQAIWSVIRPWDIEREPGRLYAHATGDDATRIYDAVAAALRAHPAGEPSDEQIQALQLELNCEPEPNELDGWAWDVCERILRFVFSVRAAPPPEGTSDE